MSVFEWEDEVDEEYVAKQRLARAQRARGDRPVRTNAEPRVQSKPESAVATANGSAGPKSGGTQERAVAKPVRLCKAQTTVRYPKAHPNESLRGQPILDADGARQYRPCAKAPMAGQEVCDRHGGRAPQAQRAAKLRLLQATEPLIAELIAIALDSRLPAADRTRAINSALDRAGFRGGVDINVAEPGYMKILGQLFGRVDGPSTQDSPIRTDAVVDADVVDVAELRRLVAEKYEPEPVPKPDPRDRADYVNGSDALPHAWRKSSPKKAAMGR